MYNGCKSKDIHLLSLDSFKKINTLEPPHYDNITGLGWLDDCLVSVSLDRHIKLWMPDRDEKMICVENTQASKGKIYLCRENPQRSLLFTGDKVGDLKFWQMKSRGSLECVGGIKVSDVDCG